MSMRGGGTYNSNSPFRNIGGVIVAILVFIGLFWFMQILFKILWFLLPVMIIATAIIDHTVIIKYANWVAKLFRTNILAGLLTTVLTFIGAPVVALFLLGRALLGKKIKSVQEEVERQQQGEFVEYEEMTSETFELPRLDDIPEVRKETRNDYDDMFK